MRTSFGLELGEFLLFRVVESFHPSSPGSRLLKSVACQCPIAEPFVAHRQDEEVDRLGWTTVSGDIRLKDRLGLIVQSFAIEAQTQCRHQSRVMWAEK